MTAEAPPPAAAPPAAPGPAAPPARTPSPEETALAQAVEDVLGPLGAPATSGPLQAWRVPAAEIAEAAGLLCDAGFDYLLFLTAVDYPAENRFEMVYVISRYSGGPAFALLTDVDRGAPEVETVSNVWMTADWHEREAYDMFGIRFRNHQFLRRIFLDEDWPGYPLRKDYVDTLHSVVKRPY